MVSVILQAWNTGRGTEHLIQLVRGIDSVQEVILMTEDISGETDSGSSANRAHVVTRRFRGYGAVVADGLWESRGDVLVFLDGDLHPGAPGTVNRLAAPILAGQADLVLPLSTGTAMSHPAPTARQLLVTCFPELAGLSSPDTANFAIRRDLLERLSLEFDGGVLAGLLVDAHFAGARIIDVDIGGLNPPSPEHWPEGIETEKVMKVILNRAEQYGRLSIGYTQEIEEIELTAKAGWAMALRRMEGTSRVALIDMDGTLLRDRSILALARRTGRLPAVLKYLENEACTPDERCELIAEALSGVGRGDFVEIARTLPLSQGAVDTVVALRRRGYRVGILSDGYQIVTDIVRRRVSADFSIGTLMHFRNGKATGQITHSPMFRHRRGCRRHRICKTNALLHMQERLAIPPVQVLAVGDGENDVCLLRDAGLGIGFEPKADSVREAAARIIYGDLRQVLHLAPLLTQTRPGEWTGLSAVPTP